MKQDLFDWLNSTHTSNTNDEGTEENLIPPLLLAPVSGELPHDEPPEPAPFGSETPQPEHSAHFGQGNLQPESSAHFSPENLQPEQSAHFAPGNPQPEQSAHFAPGNLQPEYSAPFSPGNLQPEHSAPFGQGKLQPEQSAHFSSETLQPEYSAPFSPGNLQPETSAHFGSETLQPEQSAPFGQGNLQPESSAYFGTETLQPENITAEESPADSQEYDSYPDKQHSSVLNQAWHEAAGFTMNLSEPPQEMWTDIDSDDDTRDYEENMSLQGDAYIPVPKHGANFTQRLQATLQGRKDKAAKQRKIDAENANHHPYMQKAAIFCGVLLMALGFGYLGLWFIQRETPDGINQRAMNFYEQGEFLEAENLYLRGYNRYPHVLGFLTGMARSAEKAGHTQTAIAAWNEYVSSLPKDDAEHRRAAQEELDRLIPGGRRSQTAQTIVPAKPAPAKSAAQKLPEVRELTFHEVLAEANNAYNIGMFSRAITNFHKAHALRENDIRPYIGLAASYRARGMFFESKRLLDEAKRKFWHYPTIEVERYYLSKE